MFVLFFPPQGFLAKDLQAEALKQLDKRIKGTAEQFMKTLEQIDAIVSKLAQKSAKSQQKLTVMNISFL